LKPALLVLVGAAFGYVAICAAAALFWLLAVRLPFPVAWRRSHADLVGLCYLGLALVPCVGIVGYALSTLFRRRAVLSALVSMTIAVYVAISYPSEDLHHLRHTVWTTWPLFACFLVGPPLVVSFRRYRPSRHEDMSKRRYDRWDSWLKKIGYFKKG